MTRLSGCITCVLLWLTAGCSSTLTTTPVDPAARLISKPKNGTPYYLPTGRLHVRVEWTDTSITNSSFFCTVDARMIPDRMKVFWLEPQHSIFASDEFDIATTNGLLHRISSKNKDESPQMLVQVANTVANVTRIIAATGKTEPKAKVLDCEFDPCDPTEWKTFNKQLSTFTGGQLSATINPPPVATGKLTNDIGPILTNSTAGFLYRPALPYEFSIVHKSDVPQLSTTLLLPNNAPIAAFDIRRGAFVERLTEIQFSSGIITGIKLNYPSEALGFVKIPYNITEALVKLPKELLTIKVEQTQKEKELAVALKDLLEAQTALMQARLTNAATN